LSSDLLPFIVPPKKLEFPVLTPIIWIQLCRVNITGDIIVKYMKAMRHVPGVDISTTGVKALLVSEAGDVYSSTSVGYPLLTPRPNRAEQEPQRREITDTLGIDK